jgi:hypothetical protein
VVEAGSGNLFQAANFAVIRNHGSLQFDWVILFLKLLAGRLPVAPFWDQGLARFSSDPESQAST